MISLRYVFGAADSLPHDSLRRMFTLRAEVFDRQLGWVRSNGDAEIDVFDALRPVYVLCLAGDRLAASVRLLPTSGPNMLRDVFPQLLDGQPCPSAPDIWESSRFCADSALEGVSPVAAAFKLVEGMFAAALAHGCRRIVSVSDLRVERLVRRIGVPIARFAEPQRIGSVTAMAGWADVTEKHRRLAAAAAAAASETVSAMKLAS